MKTSFIPTHAHTAGRQHEEQSSDFSVIILLFLSSGSEVGDLVLHQGGDLLQPIGQLHLLTGAVLVQRHDDLTGVGKVRVFMELLSFHFSQ